MMLFVVDYCNSGSVHLVASKQSWSISAASRK